MSDEINILYCLNDAYLYPMINMLYSMRLYNQTRVNVFVLTTSFSEQSEQKLIEHCQKLNVNAHIQRIEFEAEMKNAGHYSVDMYLRIFAFKYLPSNIHKILYVDADMLFCDDVEKIYDNNISNCKIACVAEPCQKKLKKLKHRLGVEHLYFNSGMLLMNLDNIRKGWNEENVWNYIKRYTPLLTYPDQDILNVMCKEEDLMFLNGICNNMIRHNSLKNKTKDTVLVHYVGKKKPWNVQFLRKHERLFWKVFKTTGITEFCPMKCKKLSGGGRKTSSN